MKLVFKGALAALCLAVCQLATAQDAAAPVAPPAPVAAPAGMGTLVVDVSQYTSEKELPKKVSKQLANGGLEWGIKDNQIVFTMVGKQFVDFPINHMTRYGQNESLQLPAGEYRITGIGLEAMGTLVFAFAGDFTLLVVSYVIWSGGLAFRSGNDEAFLYDTLASGEREHEYSNRVGM